MSRDFVWAYLLPLSYNMANDRPTPERDERTIFKPYMHFDISLWNDMLPRLVDAGVTMLVIDLCDGVQYESHPEIGLPDAWPKDRLRAELGRIREAGMEPIPKLNFSATHDVWLGKYSRMLSTEPYYTVCRDLIGESLDLFDKPRFFHLGMDEETAHHQRHHAYAVMRQHELWWHDLGILTDAVEAGGARPWIWSDFLWHHEEEFLSNMPKSVMQSNWYYGEKFDEAEGSARKHVRAYNTLEEHGFDQIPTGSNHSNTVNFGRTVEYCRDRIAPERLHGFFMTVWRPTTEQYRQSHSEAIELVADARRTWESA